MLSKGGGVRVPVFLEKLTSLTVVLEGRRLSFIRSSFSRDSYGSLSGIVPVSEGVWIRSGLPWGTFCSPRATYPLGNPHRWWRNKNIFLLLYRRVVSAHTHTDTSVLHPGKQEALSELKDTLQRHKSTPVAKQNQ